MQKLTFHFTHQQQGWSETFYRDAPLTDANLNILTYYIAKRMELLATQCSLVAVRQSDTDSPRDCKVFPVPPGGIGGAWTLPTTGSPSSPDGRTGPEDDFTALLLRMEAGANNSRPFALLGVPDHVYYDGAVLQSEQAGLNGRLTNWVAALQQLGVGMRAQFDAVITGDITEFFPKTATDKLVCLGVSGPRPDRGDIVILNGVKPFNYLNRAWKVAKVTTEAGVDPDTQGYIYLAKSSSHDAFGTVEGGTYKVPNYFVAPFTGFTVSRMTVRKPGVPFTTVRGRR